VPHVKKQKFPIERCGGRMLPTLKKETSVSNDERPIMGLFSFVL
jgi:hypothetical protein